MVEHTASRALTTSSVLACVCPAIGEGEDVCRQWGSNWHTKNTHVRVPKPLKAAGAQLDNGLRLRPKNLRPRVHHQIKGITMKSCIHKETKGITKSNTL